MTLNPLSYIPDPVNPGGNVMEEIIHSAPPVLGRVDWASRFPWLVQGVTVGRDQENGELDLGLWGPQPAGRVLERWETLRRELDVDRIWLARQVHGAGIRVARAGAEGIVVVAPSDGHLTRDPGVLLAVSVADCVPVFIVEPESRTLGLLHAGWRGVAAGIIERGVDAMWERFGVSADSLTVHLGPSICGDCYEVGREVHTALDLDDPGSSAELDLREHIRRRLARQGVEQVHASTVCVLEDPRFFSHRGGDSARQVALLGFRGRPGPRR